MESRKIGNEEEKNRDLPFNSLTPSVVEEMSTYEKAFNYTFDNKNVNNVAVSGSYGSGKSSVVETYFKGKNLNHITISLANFSEADIYDTEGAGSKQPDRKTREKIEGKILNQIIHQIDPEKIPLTKFKVIKKHRSNYSLRWTASVIVLFLFLTLYLLNFERWRVLSQSININYLETITAQPLSFLIALLLWIILSSSIMYSLIRKQLIRPIFRRIIIKNYEVEIFEDEEDSYFDKHLNEIIYVLENSQVRAIIFEDIDRYQTNQVFSKLREINFLVNKKLNSSNLSEKKGIKFFYLLKDEIFQSKDRTKFFDFIIPIIPVIDSSNSVNYLVRVFKDKKELGEFEDHFFERISLYIDDMRLLKNIINEYFIYRDRIQQEDLNSRNLISDTKLFSIITYKNIFPKDFTALQFNSGFVSTIFTSYFELKKKSLIQDNETLIEKNAKLINDIKNEHLKSINELRLVRQGTHMSSKEYENRQEFISNKDDKRIEEIENQNRNLNEQILGIKYLSIKELYNLSNVNPLKDPDLKELDINSQWFNEINTNPYKDLIVYLVKEGLIDETYQDYITYFYSDYLRLNDKTFLRSITDQKAVNYAHKLQNPKMIANKLKSSDFLKPQLLNFDLFEYAALEDKQLLRQLLNLISIQKKYDFIYQYLEFDYLNYKNEVIHIAFDTIIINQPCILISHLTLDSTFIPYENNLMISNAFWSLKFDYEDSNESNDDLLRGISVYISDAKGILSSIIYWAELRLIDYNKMFERLLKLKVKFIKIDPTIEIEIISQIIRDNLFDINKHNLNLLAEIFMKEKTFNYTSILNTNLTEVIEYLEANYNELMDVLLEKDTLKEEEISFLRLINADSINDKRKSRFIDKVETSIGKLSKIKNVEYWTIAIERNIVCFSKENILSYFNYYGDFNKVLSNFINSNDKVLKIHSNELITLYGQKIHDKFYKKLLSSTELDNDKVRMLLKESNFILSELDVIYEEIPNETLMTLLDLDLVDVTVDLLKYIKDSNEYLIETLLLNRHFEVARHKEYVNFDYSAHIKKILEADNVSDNLKVDILKHFVGTRIKYSESYSLSVNKEIINSNSYIEDIRILIKDEKSEQIVSHLVAYSIAHQDLTNDTWKYPYYFLKRVLSERSLRMSVKETMFLNHLELLDLEQCKEVLFILRKPVLISLLKMEGKKPKLYNNVFNLRVIRHFDAKGWISSFEVNAKNIIGRSFRRTSNKKA